VFFFSWTPYLLLSLFGLRGLWFYYDCIIVIYSHNVYCLLHLSPSVKPGSPSLSALDKKSGSKVGGRVGHLGVGGEEEHCTLVSLDLSS
jgi:hypothetical protein